jgi:LmbE family N-acetylglucosaminyl deacetylase
VTPLPRRLEGQVVLAVFAHPDDESLACGGTLALLADAGARVVVMCASHGERGSEIGPVRDDALGRERAAELCAAARELGVSELRIYSHPDGDLRWAEITEFNAELVLFLRRRQTAAVLTFDEDGLYWHADHIAVYERVLTAMRALGPDAPPLYHVTIPATVMPNIVNAARARGWMPPAKGFWSIVPESYGLFAKPYTIEINVQSVLPRKLAAIAAHRTQMGKGHPLCEPSPDEARRWLGVEYFRRADLQGGAGTVLEQLCTSTC